MPSVIDPVLEFLREPTPQAWQQAAVEHLPELLIDHANCEKKALLYGFFIVLIYGFLSVPFHLIDNLNPEFLNTIATNITLNLAFFVVFVAFAFSFFGYFELTLPSRWTNRSDSASQWSGAGGIFFMALTLALVSFSCTGPILGSLLAGSLSTS
ncbi:MAG: hypothetical protein GWP50_02990, partial [Proteobacteria bacterium]|nr:hypothetical protein [Pseudomonadota bacterium]